MGPDRPLGRVVVEELGDRTLELGQAVVHLDHFVRADWFRWVDVSLVLRPLVSAVTAVELVSDGP